MRNPRAALRRAVHRLLDDLVRLMNTRRGNLSLRELESLAESLSILAPLLDQLSDSRSPS
jgi:hypothetical protein